MNAPASRKQNLLCGLVLTLAVAVVWGRSLGFGLVWDDNYFIVKNASIRSLANVPEMFYSLQAQAAMPEKFVVFRPLRNVQYALLYFLGGGEAAQPWLFHLANLIWQIGAAWLFFSVLRLLLARFHPASGENPRLALWGALAFAVHPVAAEVVCWAKSLDDIMATVFTLASCRALLLWRQGNRQYGVALLWFLLAVYAKESAVPFALLVFFVFQKIHCLPLRKNLLLTAGFLAVALFYVVNRHLVLGRTSQIDPISGSYGRTLLDMLPVVTEYARLLLGIPPFCADYSHQVGHPGWSTGQMRAGGLLLGLLLVLGFAAWRSQRFWLAGFGLLWTGLFLLPVSNAIPMMQYMAERFVYLPLIGWLMAGTILAAQLSRRVAALVLPLVIIVWAALAWQRAGIWHDEWTLFSQTSRECPPMSRVDNNAVIALLAQPQFKAIFDYNPDTERLSVRETGTPEDTGRALAVLLEARKQFPEDEKLSKALAFLCLKLNRPEAATLFFLKAAQRAPAALENWNNLALAAIAARDWPVAGDATARALRLAPDDLNTLQIALNYRWQTEDFAGALECLKRIKLADPQNPDTDHWIKLAEEKLGGKKSP